MAKKRMLVLFCLVLGALFLLGVGPVSADESNASQMFEVRLQVQADGTWALLSLGGMELGLNSENFGALADLLSLQMDVPEIDPSLVKIAMMNDIQNMVVVKQGDRTTILINNQPLSTLTIGEPVVAAVRGLAPELEELIEGVGETNIAIVAYFPSGAGEEQTVDMTQTLEAEAAAEPPQNTIQLASTLSSQGQLLAVAGIPVDQLGLGEVGLDTPLLKQLGVQELNVDLGEPGVRIAVNEEEWVGLAWDFDQLKGKILPIVFGLTGMETSRETEQIITVASEWLQISQFAISAQVADEPQPGVTSIRLERPLMVELMTEDGVKIEGITLPMNLAGLAPYLKHIQSAGLGWSGDQDALFLTVNDRQLPYLRLGEGFLGAAAPLLGSDPVLIGQAGAILADSGFTVSVSTEGNAAPDLGLLTYKAEPSKPLLSLVPRFAVSRQDGGVALYGGTIPLSFIETLTGISLKQIVAQMAGQLQDADTALVVLGPDGLGLGLDGTGAQLVWDNDLRDHLVNLASDLLLDDRLDLLPLLSPQLERRAIRGVLGLVNQFRLGVEIELRDESLPAGFLGG